MQKMFLVFSVLMVMAIGLLNQVSHGYCSDDNVLFILDCSGSMWGRVEGKPKIVIAKTLLKELVSTLPSHMNMGLMAYGHSRKGDCSDIAMVSDMDGSCEKLDAALSHLIPKGKTPIAEALEKGVAVLSRLENPGTVVLISDGMETCGGTPCELVNSFREKGIALTVHVIGFQVGGETENQLQCIANAGNGGYFSAKNTTELRASLEQIKGSVLEHSPLPKPPEPAQITIKEAKSKRLKLPGPGTVILKPADWVSMPPKYWALIDAETGQNIARSNKESLRVKPGEYQVMWRQSEHGHSDTNLTSTVTVNSRQKVFLPLDTGIRLNLPEGIKTPKWWALSQVNGGAVVARFSQTLSPQVVPAGEYDLLWRQSEHGSQTVNMGAVNLEAGRLNDVLLDMGVHVVRAEWLESSFKKMSVFNEANQLVGQWRHEDASLLPQGDYRLIIRPTEHHHSDVIWGKFKVLEHGFTTVSIDSGIKFIYTPDTPAPYAIIFVNLKSNDEITMKETWAPQPLPPGKYRLDWWEDQHNATRQTLIDSFEIPPHTMIEMEI
ncbi:Ca-activated chloride channel family protein [Desulfocicer vacuolatum DSM 3385]|uniref:Ca-activated chloride channel family protein n=2 Tax=Desulfocicer vacuolatum TaxID=2298 RepID=A0A1W2E8Y1_9BACT|nr:Ca-activated chloride channel family protein [Desulfocicer vacuolatum DSM 3385]